MLAMIGSVIIDIYPFSVDAIDQKRQSDYAEKPVLGKRPPLEFVGDGAETVTLTGQLLPEKLGGLDEVEQVNQMRQSGIPQYFMRGDGVPMGWFVVGDISLKSSNIGSNGVGRVVQHEITLRRADAPTGDDFFAAIAGMLE